MLTDNQKLVFDWLNEKLQLPVFAEVYKGALKLLDSQTPGYVTFVAHAGRDLMNTLARTVSGVKSSRFEYQQHLDKLKTEWHEEWGAKGINKMDNAENGHLVPFKTCQKVKNLIEDYEKGHLRSKEAGELFFTTFLSYEDIEQIPPNFWSEWKLAKKWFEKHTHLRKEGFSDNTKNDVLKHFKTLDDLLYVAASSEYDRLKDIHEILEETNQ